MESYGDNTDGGHFNAVIVGSGFGGSVMAYRLAKARQTVCVLERGKAYPPGSFPRSPFRMPGNFWDPSAGLHGLFNLWSFQHLDAVVASGLGGGSLIYANVLLRKDKRWFVQDQPVPGGGVEHWPVTYDDLEPHYERVERMMGVQRYPVDHLPYRETPKTKAFIEAAERQHLEYCHPPLAVTFANPNKPPRPGEQIQEPDGPNLHEMPRSTCRLCGECDIGCNFGSKNTLDYTYLTAARRHGAVLRVLREVRCFERRPEGGFTIYYVRHEPDPERELLKTDTNHLTLHKVTADRLILAAGTLGTTYLLLKNQSAFPGLSARLGTRFCGNGDFLGFALKSTETRGGRRVPRVIDAARGPVITSTARVPDEMDGEAIGERGFYVQDAGYPELANWLVEAADLPRMGMRKVRFAAWLLRNRLRSRPDTNLSAEVASLFGPGVLSSGVLPLLGMGRDRPDGRLFLCDGHLQSDWRKDKSGPYFSRLRSTMRGLAEALGADFLENPTWYLRRLVTVHPLGGCPMGRNASEGVVDSYGRVFGPDGVFKDLYIADGSVMPGPVGPNPSLTIAALADRFADGIIESAVAAS